MTEETRQAPAKPREVATAPRVSVLIPTFRDANLLRKSLPVLLASPPEVEIVVLNNDAEQDVAAAIGDSADDPRVRIVEMGYPAGPVGAFNRGMREADGELVFYCNADLFPTESFLAEMIRFFEEHPGAGAAMGKLLRYDLDADRPTDVIDSGEIVLTRQRRMMQRVEGEPDVGQCDDVREVFALDGAAVVVRRAALEDIRFGDEYLDRNFFTHKDDHDLSWRIRLAGWECWLNGKAVAYHGRTTRGLGTVGYLSSIRAFHENERAKPLSVRTHAMKNQWLMLLKNEDGHNFVRDFPFILGREAMVVGYNLVFAPRSLVAVPQVLRVLPETLRKRRAAKRRQKMDPRELRRWLRSEP